MPSTNNPNLNHPGFDFTQVARVCHEANRAYCILLGDFSQTRWEDAPDWQIASARAGVEFRALNPSAPPAAMHESWFAKKVADGWVYGEKKDEAAKTHPCMRPWTELPESQRRKDVLFSAVVDALTRNVDLS